MNVKFPAVPQLAIHNPYKLSHQQEEHEINYPNHSHRDVSFSCVIERAINQDG